MKQEGLYHFTPIPDAPQMADRVYRELQTVESLGLLNSDYSFTDRLGRTVSIPVNIRKNSVKPITAEGYCKAVWDYKNGDMLLGEDEKTIYGVYVSLPGT